MGKKQNEVAIPDEVVMNKIYVIRSQKVMLDKDLAELYKVETKQLKRAVRRNADRFPDDFMFELSKEEFDNLRNQIGTSSWGGTRYAPMAFTEQGVAMLSSVLNSDRAIKVNIQIVRTRPPRNPQAGPLLFFLPIEGQEKTRIEKAVFSRSGA
jgi:hypothetical protein